MAAGFQDIKAMLQSMPIVLFMAWSDVRARYKRSVLGPFWITLSTAIGVVGLGLIWSELFKIERKVYVPMLTVGLIMWQFLSTTIGEASGVFVRQSGIIKNLNLPLSFHPAQLLLRQIINFFHAIPLYFVVVLVLGVPLSATAFWALPAFLLVALNLFWMTLLIGVLGTRFRDLEYLIGMVLPLLMFFSPVMYKTESLPFTKKMIWLNPLAHMIEVVREPLLGQMPSAFVVFSNLAFLLLGGTVALVLFNKKCKRIALWI